MWDVVVSLLGSVLDYTRAVYQIVTESIRNCFRFGPVVIANRKRRRTAKRNRCNSLPELEDCVVEPSFGSENGAFDLLDESSSANELREIMVTQTSSMDRRGWEWGPVPRELEPAFLKESDYPAGWMVYHPVLRVVTKTEADKYDREQAEKHLQQQQQLLSETNHNNIAGQEDEHAEEKKDDLAGGEPKRELSCEISGIHESSRRSPNQKLPQQQQQGKHASSGSMPVLRSVVAT